METVRERILADIKSTLENITQANGYNFNFSPQTVQRYIKDRAVSNRITWRLNYKCGSLPVGKVLRIELPAPGSVHWSSDYWKTITDSAARDTGLQTYIVDLPSGGLPLGSALVFTIHWLDDDRWEGSDYAVSII